jgi:hypothetical protein
LQIEEAADSLQFLQSAICNLQSSISCGGANGFSSLEHFSWHTAQLQA